MPGTVTLIDPQGIAREVSAEAAGSALDQPGWRLQTEGDRLGRLADEAKEETYGGVGGAVKATLAAGARGATLGLSDVAARALGGDDARFDLEALRDVNPGLSTAGELAGSLAPALLSGGALTPAGATARLGSSIAELGEGAGALGRIGAGVAGGATEGALYGLGSGVSELSLSDDPLTLEHAVSTLSSHALFGAATGGLAGGAIKGAEIGLARAKGAIDGALERRAAKALTPAEAIESGDLSMLDKPTLTAAREQEIEAIEKSREPARQQFVDDLTEFRAKGQKEQLWAATEGTSERGVRTAGRNFTKADLELDSLLANKTGLASRPQRALGALQKQRQALDEIDAYGKRLLSDYDATLQTDPDIVRGAIAAKQVPGELGPFTADGLNYAVEREIARRQAAFEAGPGPDMLKKMSKLAKVPAAIERNERLQKAIAELGAEPTSVKLTKIMEAEEALGIPRVPSLAEQVVGAIPFGGPLATIMGASKKAIGGLRGAAGKAAERTGKAVSSFLDVSAKGAARSAKYAPAVATKVLSGLSYAPPSTQAQSGVQPAPPAKGDSALPALYKARTDEIKSQVHIAPDGSFQMRPESRARMAARLDGVRAADPRLADQLETAAARRIAYLASIMPRLPDFGTVQIGPERRRVSDEAMRAWTRAAAALENPDAVFERAGRGGVVVPEEASALRAVLPGKLSDFTRRITAELPMLERNLPRSKRMSLWVLTGVPIDAAMTAPVLRVIQGMYASEPGTKGGTQAPTPQPQFGSVRADKGTKAQQRQGENT